MKRTQRRMLLDALLRGERLSQLDALNRYGIGRLAARVKELRDGGWPVRSVNVTENGKTFARYHMAGKWSP